MAKSAIMTVSDQSFTAKLARDQKRATDYRRKWQYGETSGRGAGDRVRPARQHPNGRDPWEDMYRHHGPNSDKWNIEEADVKARLNGYRPTRFHSEFPDSQSHGIEAEEGDVPVTPASNVASGYFYSFDRPTGPSSGEHVLGAAVDQAVERFENKATETLVKNEYDLVSDAASEAGEAHVHDEDFELV